MRVILKNYTYHVMVQVLPRSTTEQINNFFKSISLFVFLQFRHREGVATATATAA